MWQELATSYVIAVDNKIIALLTLPVFVYF
jgi:hypothetical protein